MTRTPHIPARSCVGCGRRAAQTDLVRFVASDQGDLCLDRDRTRGGRGAYLHADRACGDAFLARKGSVRSLRRTVDRPRRAALVEQLWNVR